MLPQLRLALLAATKRGSVPPIAASAAAGPSDTANFQPNRAADQFASAASNCLALSAASQTVLPNCTSPGR